MKKLASVLGLLLLLALGKLYAETINTNQNYGTILTENLADANADESNHYYTRQGTPRSTDRHVNSFTLHYILSRADTAVVALEGSLDESNWFYIDTDGTKTLSAAGSYSYTVTNIANIPWIRFRKVSDSDSLNVLTLYWVFGEN